MMWIKILNKHWPLGLDPGPRPGDSVEKLIATDMGIAELAIMKILCNDNIVDKHKATAAELYGIPIDEVTPEQRVVGKRRNFSLLYSEYDVDSLLRS